MKLKNKKCKICANEFTPRNSLQKCCSMECALIFAKQSKAEAEQKANNKRKKVFREENKTLNALTQEAQAAVNKYIRLRDEGKTCISCGVPWVREGVGGGFDAGHYRSRGSAPHLRFYTLNIAGQCKRCNRYLGGNYQQFRLGLIDRLGVEKVDAIEADQRARHYSQNDLRRIKKIFSKKCKLLEKRKGLSCQVSC